MEGVYGIIIAEVEVKTMPDAVFWYTLCVLMIGVLIWGVKRELDNNKSSFDKHGILITEMGKCIIELTTITKVHEVQIQNLLKASEKMGDDLETLREFYIVTYKK